MDVSIVIVTKNRSKELAKTLNILKPYLDLEMHEVLVFIDGCSDTLDIMTSFEWVRWFKSEKSIGASPARNQLYQQASGKIYIGFDDDAHPLTTTFIKDVQNLFHKTKDLGIIAFKEIKGIFESDIQALNYGIEESEHYYTNDFIGCGFAISAEAYKKTNGFPTWMTIYGEETCVAWEVLHNKYKILYTNQIKVNHRVDLEARKKTGKNYFRFKHQLINTINFYLVYYQKPFIPIIKVIINNGKKYGFKNKTYFKNYMFALAQVVYKLPKTLKSRAPIAMDTINTFKQLEALKY